MSTEYTPGAQAPVKVSTGKIAVAWALVGVPLAYGIYQTLTRVAALFGLYRAQAKRCRRPTGNPVGRLLRFSRGISAN